MGEGGRENGACLRYAITHLNLPLLTLTWWLSILQSYTCLLSSSVTDASPCESCAAGKYGPTAGASSHDVCLDCEEGKANGEEGASSCNECTGGSSDDSTYCLCGLESGNKANGPWPGLSLPEGRSIRLCSNWLCTDNPPMFPGPTFDENGEVWGRLELKVGGEWVTIRDYVLYNDWDFGNEVAQVGCRQLGNELGYTLLSWDLVRGIENGGLSPMGSGSQYNVGNCQVNEDELSSCGHFKEGGIFIHQQDAGLRCSFAIAGDECEECPPGKYRYACA